MASTSLVPSQHHTISSQHALDMAATAESGEMVSQWPALSSENDTNKESEWEIIPSSTEGFAKSSNVPVVTFDSEALKPRNPKILKHAQSSPDFRAFHATDEGDEETSSAILVDDETSMASSSMDLVSEAPSVWSVGSNKLTFKDAILQNHALPVRATTAGANKPPKKTTFNPKIVVVKPSSTMKRPKSMGNLRALDHIQEEVLGDTDAGDFYLRKAQGALGRRNGKKTRPDEAKRLEITMAKKTLQKQRQRG